MKAGDQVWHHGAQRSLVIAVVDVDAQRFAVASSPAVAPWDGDEWVALEEVSKQFEAARDDERAMLLASAKKPGRVGECARAEIGRQWGDGSWTKP